MEGAYSCSLRHLQQDQSNESSEASRRKKTKELRDEARQLREQAREPLKVECSHSKIGTGIFS